MRLDGDKSIKRLFLVTLLAYALDFVFFYVMYLFATGSFIMEYSEAYEALYYLYNFVCDAISFVLPSLAVLYLIPKAFDKNFIRLIPTALYLSAPAAAFSLIKYYIDFVLQRYTSVEAVLFGAAISLLLLLGTALAVSLLAFILRRLLQKRGMDKDSFLADTAPYFDIASPITLSVFIICFVRFSVSLAIEIFSTVSFFIDVGDTFRVGELIYVLMRFVFIAAMLILSHSLFVFIKNKSGGCDA